MTDDRVIRAIPASEFNLEGLDPSLHEYVDWDGRNGPVFDHPLYRDISMRLTAAMPANWPNGAPAGLARINDIVSRQQATANEFEESQEWASFVYTHHRPYRVNALLHVVRKVGASRLWRLIGDVWRDSESNTQSSFEWAEIWSHAYDSRGNFRKCHKQVMGAKDRRAFETLPEFITVYRGCFDEDDIYAYSWTLEREKAEWFARRKRSSGAPVLAKLEVHKSFALAFFSDRNESEIVLDYNAGMDDYEPEIIELASEMQEAA